MRCYEVGPDQLATMVTVANLLQEVAANHAQELWGAGAWAPALMTEQHLAFALSKLHIRLDAPLQWCTPRRAARMCRAVTGCADTPCDPFSSLAGALRFVCARGSRRLARWLRVATGR